MAIPGKARELIQRWHELRGKGQVLTAEELCRNHPECLAAVKQQIAQLKAAAASPTGQPAPSSGQAPPSTGQPAPSTGRP